MPDQLPRSQGTQPPPVQALPQRLSRTTTASAAPAHHHDYSAVIPSQPRTESTRQRNPRHTGPVNILSRQLSSDESNGTDISDPKKWFDRSNDNPGQSFGPRSMDVDPPFFQKESDSSNGEAGKDVAVSPFGPRRPQPPQRHLTEAVTASSAEDYRSVIDDLTIEIKKLKEELRKYKPTVPEPLRKDALFEVRVYGLDRGKKRELENTLRQFATSIEGSSAVGDSPRRHKSSMRANRLLLSSGSGSKHGTSSSGHSRPVDSAYASMSIMGTGSSNLNMADAPAPRSSLPDRAKIAEQKVQSYLKDIPEGLLPRPVVMTEKERKKLVVRKLEKLFTGKLGGKNSRKVVVPADSEPPGQQSAKSLPPSMVESAQPSREARMLLSTGDFAPKRANSRGNVSASVSRGEQTEPGGASAGVTQGHNRGNGNDGGNDGGGGRNSGRKNLTSPQSASTPDQRPTRPHDLDPDRIQLPSENMDYIRHLGIVAPSHLPESKCNPDDVPADANGWVYLNLLCNLAQMHMLNVTPAFIRNAVSEMSTKFWLSPDGQKIRWRGGTHGTKFSSDSSGDNSQRGGSADEDRSVTGAQRKKQKTDHSCDGQTIVTSPTSRQQKPGAGHSVSTRPDTFHYKPLFARHSPSPEQNSDEAFSMGSLGRGVNSNGNTNSKWNYSGGGSSRSWSCRTNGAIVFYSGVPFVTDLSRDPGDQSTSTYEASPDSKLRDSPMLPHPMVQRTQVESAAQMCSMKKTDLVSAHDAMDVSQDQSGSMPDYSDWDLNSDIDLFPWSEERLEPTKPCLYDMEAAGLGGIIPDDHFSVHVTTRRPIQRPDANSGSGNRKTRSGHHNKSPEAVDTMISRIARISTAAAAPPSHPSSRNIRYPIEIEYLSSEVKKLQPVSLPPPATFLPPFSSDSEENMSDSLLDSSDEGDESSELVQPENIGDREELMSRLANPHLSDNTYPEESELSNADVEDEVDPDAEAAYDSSGSSGEHLPDATAGGRDLSGGLTGSSAATAGDEMESGYSSEEDDTSIN